MPTLIILRHGQSEFNNLNKFCGWLDAKLTDKGKEQAKFASNLIKSSNLKPNYIFTSKLTRTIQTGNLILEDLDRQWIDVTRSWRLNERHYGALQGCDKSEIRSQVGDEQYMFWRRAYDGIPPLIEKDQEASAIDERYKYEIDEVPKGESLHMVVDRLKSLLYGDILKKLIERDVVLVVAHGSACRSILKLIKKISDEDIKDINIPNAIPLVMNVDDDLNLIGDEYYLDPEIAKERAAAVAKEGW
ncbi:phosphoglycerate mutase [Wickerhamomyces ciferrii]|uniref:Phosphoglycerate mutase n=1 Tax=Wickerhamomyces ciferrii (strain ATCC 14091 / BCRC 22168 / CBS 111 / JCM 3599 / NBRC 0793 / NRRL Y-1031 F-60-10) TaxID=1206466 RepID=K0KQS6_WICCF|nr:phosphoglycerate mutase [Wickerhamomyces ciferrii]CCH45441.1 phosphoglycerate mutase [Wickerhamomyces ciferrii]